MGWKQKVKEVRSWFAHVVLDISAILCLRALLCFLLHPHLSPEVACPGLVHEGSSLSVVNNF